MNEQPTELDRLDPWPARSQAYDARFDIPRWGAWSAQRDD